MKLSFNSGALRNVKTDAIAIGLVEKKFKSSEHLRALDKLAGGKISSLLRSREFEARPGQVIEINGLRSVRADHSGPSARTDGRPARAHRAGPGLP